MCGVFGFVAKDKGPLNLKNLQRVATVTQRRGPHAWGMAWINSNGRMFMYKQTGRIRDSLGLLAMARDAVVLIGHTRYATQGDPANNLNNHPHPCDGGWIVHNGMIPNYREIATQYDLHLTTQCDSEVLCRLVEQLNGNLVSRCAETANIVGSPNLVMLGLWKPDRLIAMRRGNPLHVGETGCGFYLASLADGLPGDVSELADKQAIEFGTAG